METPSSTSLRDAWYAEAKDIDKDTLPKFLEKLFNTKHDYNTICYAMAATALASMHALDRSPTGGITGFQASAIMWEFVEQWMNWTSPHRFQDMSDLLYPQMENKFTTITEETWEWVQKEAKKQLEDNQQRASYAVVNHWKTIEDGVIPFGLKIAEN